MKYVVNFLYWLLVVHVSLFQVYIIVIVPGPLNGISLTTLTEPAVLRPICRADYGSAEK